MPSPVTNRLPAHGRIKATLCDRIGTQWERGHRLPTVRQLAVELDAGFGSVQRAVRDMTEAGVLISRRRSGTFVSPLADEAAVRRVLERDLNRWARSPSGSLAKARAVVFFDPSAHAHFYAALASHLLPKGCQLQNEPHHISNDFRDWKTEAGALILIQPNSVPEIQVAPNQILVVVSTTPDISVAVSGRYDIVTTEHEHGAFLAGWHFRKLGIESACFVGVSRKPGSLDPDRTSAVRLKGFERGWGRPVPAACRFLCASYDTYRPEDILDRYRALSPRPAGVFAASDELATGFVESARVRSLTAPRDYQLIGFDGLENGGKAAGESLTTISVPCREMGRRAALLLEHRLREPDAPVQRLALGCALRVGTTTRSLEGGGPASDPGASKP